VTAETFRQEIAEAMKAYEKYIICIEKAPDEFHTSLVSLLNKALKAYESRGPQLRHGIALDRQVTVILSQSDSPRPSLWHLFQPATRLTKSRLHPERSKPSVSPLPAATRTEQSAAG
jgi:hypothetical protein